MIGDWIREEVEAAVTDYFLMLEQELRGLPYNKAEHNRNLRKLLTNRSAGSIERKHQNISAILIGVGFPYIKGYKPLGNFQLLLGTVVEERLKSAQTLHALAANIVNLPADSIPVVDDIEDLYVTPPTRDDLTQKLYETSQFVPQGRHCNYLQMEALNRSIGNAGEEFVLHLEHRRLWLAGKRSLAEKIEHVSRTKGDGMGYDVLSFEESGKERHIEVKTTTFGPMTPFFVSRNEVLASKALAETYQLYRLFSFRELPKLYALQGSLQNCCELVPTNFSAFPING